jgi:capsular polysaccharide transport system ATP-binding protein
MIRIRNVSKYYPVKSGVRHILRDVTLDIPGSTNLAVLGPNGAGKSTFLRLIGGSEAPNSGSIGSELSISWPLGLSSGFQGTLSGRQNVMFACRINGLNLSQKRQVINEVVEFAELGEYFDLPVKTYSSGMRARLSFGLSMAFKFDVYLIDELTSVGDAVFRAKAKRAFEHLRNRASIIFVSHNLQTLRETCDSALFLHDGTATFFEDIEVGIATYAEYIRANRLVHAKEIHQLKQANRALRKQQRRSERETSEANDPTPSTENPPTA